MSTKRRPSISADLRPWGQDGGRVHTVDECLLLLLAGCCLSVVPATTSILSRRKTNGANPSHLSLFQDAANAVAWFSGRAVVAAVREDTWRALPALDEAVTQPESPRSALRNKHFQRSVRHMDEPYKRFCAAHLGKAAKFPFAAINPEEARIPVPDPRFDWLCDTYKPTNRVPAHLTCIDIASLTAGASTGADLRNTFLSHVCTVGGIFQDIEWVEKHLKHLKKTGRSLGSNSLADKARMEDTATMQRIYDALTKDNKDVRKVDWVGKETLALGAGESRDHAATVASLKSLLSHPEQPSTKRCKVFCTCRIDQWMFKRVVMAAGAEEMLEGPWVAQWCKMCVTHGKKSVVGTFDLTLTVFKKLAPVSVGCIHGIKGILFSCECNRTLGEGVKRSRLCDRSWTDEPGVERLSRIASNASLGPGGASDACKGESRGFYGLAHSSHNEKN
ncbi:hypothetical protein LXA43DRAFT_1066881 [Ganoderma leucocontextum]|nr:hypothetical protein LXA43DRAFT_1066881 [Ganoderma leucocontextum]